MEAVAGAEREAVREAAATVDGVEATTEGAPMEEEWTVAHQVEAAREEWTVAPMVEAAMEEESRAVPSEEAGSEALAEAEHAEGPTEEVHGVAVQKVECQEAATTAAMASSAEEMVDPRTPESVEADLEEAAET